VQLPTQQSAGCEKIGAKKQMLEGVETAHCRHRAAKRRKIKAVPEVIKSLMPKKARPPKTGREASGQGPFQQINTRGIGRHRQHQEIRKICGATSRSI